MLAIRNSILIRILFIFSGTPSYSIHILAILRDEIAANSPPAFILRMMISRGLEMAHSVPSDSSLLSSAECCCPYAQKRPGSKFARVLSFSQLLIRVTGHPFNPAVALRTHGIR